MGWNRTQLGNSLPGSYPTIYIGIFCSTNLAMPGTFKDGAMEHWIFGAACCAVLSICVSQGPNNFSGQFPPSSAFPISSVALVRGLALPLFLPLLNKTSATVPAEDLHDRLSSLFQRLVSPHSLRTISLDSASPSSYFGRDSLLQHPLQLTDATSLSPLIVFFRSNHYLKLKAEKTPLISRVVFNHIGSRPSYAALNSPD